MSEIVSDENLHHKYMHKKCKSKLILSIKDNDGFLNEKYKFLNLHQNQWVKGELAN